MNWLDTFPGRRKEPGSSFPRHWRKPGSGRERRTPWASSSPAQGARGREGSRPSMKKKLA